MLHCRRDVAPYALYAYHEAFGEGTRGTYTLARRGLRGRASPGVRKEPPFSGVPVLFVPGSGGSYKQVRTGLACRAALVSCVQRLTR